MTRDDFRAILDLMAGAFPSGVWEISGRVRAQLYRLREKLRFRDLYFDYDCLTFRPVEGDLCIIRRVEVPPVDDAIQMMQPAQMTKSERVELPTWPHRRDRAAHW